MSESQNEQSEYCQSMVIYKYVIQKLLKSECFQKAMACENAVCENAI